MTTEPSKEEPDGQLTIRTVARPADTNPEGDIFGGWLVCQMDMAAAVLAQKTCQSRAVTVSIDSLVFLVPVKVGDNVCCYTKLLDVGRTSMKIKVQVWTTPRYSGLRQKVTEGIFKFVAVDDGDPFKPHPVYRT
jgi:acyl-CoA thioesterase YciA